MCCASAGSFILQSHKAVSAKLSFGREFDEGASPTPSGRMPFAFAAGAEGSAVFIGACWCGIGHLTEGPPTGGADHTPLPAFCVGFYADHFHVGSMRAFSKICRQQTGHRAGLKAWEPLRNSSEHHPGAGDHATEARQERG